MKSLWEDPKKFRAVNGWLVVFWTALVPISYAMGWLTSVVYVSALSLYAIVTGHLATWQSARVEVLQEQERRERDDDFERRIEEKINSILQSCGG